jgi:hypothetical protein
MYETKGAKEVKLSRVSEIAGSVKCDTRPVAWARFPRAGAGRAYK